MYFQIYDENQAVLVCQKKNIKIVGIALIIIGIITFGLMLPYTDPIHIPIVSILPFAIILFGFFVIFYKTSVIIDRSKGKVIRQTNLFGFYNWVRNVWDLEKIRKLEREYWGYDVEDPAYNYFYLTFFDQKDKVTIFRSGFEYENIIKHFNLFLKGKYSEPSIIE
ncbi:MAG: hypothetical protein ACFFAE_15865 [Candidatus Hodarchaeota archaeon]